MVMFMDSARNVSTCESSISSMMVSDAAREDPGRAVKWVIVEDEGCPATESPVGGGVSREATLGISWFSCTKISISHCFVPFFFYGIFNDANILTLIVCSAISIVMAELTLVLIRFK